VQPAAAVGASGSGANAAASVQVSQAVAGSTAAVPPLSGLLVKQAAFEHRHLAAEDHFDITALIDSRLVQLRRDIKSMRIYYGPDLVTFVFNNLNALTGKVTTQTGASGVEEKSLSFRDLLPFDQHHYGGVDAVTLMVNTLGLASPHAKPGGKVINVGSGVGKPCYIYVRLFADGLGSVDSSRMWS